MHQTKQKSKTKLVSMKEKRGFSSRCCLLYLVLLLLSAGGVEGSPWHNRKSFWSLRSSSESQPTPRHPLWYPTTGRLLCKPIPYSTHFFRNLECLSTTCQARLRIKLWLLVVYVGCAYIRTQNSFEKMLK